MSNHMLTPFKMHQQDKLPIKTWGENVRQIVVMRSNNLNITIT